MTFLNALGVPLECNIRLGVDLAKHQSFGPFLETLENASGGLRDLIRVQETTFAGSPGTIGDRWAVHLWDRNSKLAFAITFRNPQSKAQTEALIWLLQRALQAVQPHVPGVVPYDEPIRHIVWHVHPRLALPLKRHRPRVRRLRLCRGGIDARSRL